MQRRSSRLDTIAAAIAGEISVGLDAQPPLADVTKLVWQFLLTGKTSKPPSPKAPLGSLLPD